MYKCIFILMIGFIRMKIKVLIGIFVEYKKEVNLVNNLLGSLIYLMCFSFKSIKMFKKSIEWLLFSINWSELKK